MFRSLSFPPAEVRAVSIAVETGANLGFGVAASADVGRDREAEVVVAEVVAYFFPREAGFVVQPGGRMESGP